MGANSTIEWIDHIDPHATGRVLGAYKTAAKRSGCTLEEWIANRLAGLRRCFRCKTWKAVTLFALDESRLGSRASSCKPCVSIASTASRYAITRAQLDEMVERQGAACLICGEVRPLVVDHDHGTGVVRAMLCNRCNVGLGFIKDRAYVAAATAYLERHNG